MLVSEWKTKTKTCLTILDLIQFSLFSLALIFLLLSILYNHLISAGQERDSRLISILKLNKDEWEHKVDNSTSTWKWDVWLMQEIQSIGMLKNKKYDIQIFSFKWIIESLDWWTKLIYLFNIRGLGWRHISDMKDISSWNGRRRYLIQSVNRNK